jgi:hypothetical protein
MFTLSDEDVLPLDNQPQQHVTPTQETSTLAPFVIRALPSSLSAPEHEPLRLVAHVLVPDAATDPAVTWFFDREPLSSAGNSADYKVLTL